VTLSPRAIAALLAGVLLVVGLAFGLDWLVALVVLAIIALLTAYAVGLLARGQSEWFDREQRRR